MYITPCKRLRNGAEVAWQVAWKQTSAVAAWLDAHPQHGTYVRIERDDVAFWRAQGVTCWALFFTDAGLVCLDLDRHGEADGVEAFEAFRAAHGIPRPAMYTTTRSGVHVWYRGLGVTYPRHVSELPGVDIYSPTDGGFVYAAGSVRGGVTYQQHGDTPEQIPDALHEVLAAHVKTKRSQAPRMPKAANGNWWARRAESIAVMYDGAEGFVAYLAEKYPQYTAAELRAIVQGEL